MSQIGFYRYKTTADAAKSVNWLVNSTVVATKTVTPIPVCAEDLRIKFLDKNGHFRFFPLSRRYETTDRPRSIGSVNKFLTNILTDQSDTSNIGYENSRQINATAEVSESQLEIFSDLYDSPRAYLYISSGASDGLADWLEVTIQAAQNIVKRRKGAAGTVALNITLPKHYSIKMI